MLYRRKRGRYVFPYKMIGKVGWVVVIYCLTWYFLKYFLLAKCRFAGILSYLLVVCFYFPIFPYHVHLMKFFAPFGFCWDDAFFIALYQ